MSGDLGDVVAGCVSGERDVWHAPTEARFHAAWHASDVPQLESSIALAAAGGMASDRLAWVFVSGYQGSLRAAFPNLPGDGWAAFLVSEESGSGAAPGVTVTGGHLSGNKSWVAASDHVRHLVVGVGQRDDASYHHVSSDAPGVTLLPPRDPGRDGERFLDGLSMGRARFDAAAADPVDAARVRHFVSFEAVHVAAALAGFVASRGLSTGLPPAICGGALAVLAALDSLGTDDLGSDAARLTMAGIDRHLAATIDAFESAVTSRGTAPPGWHADRRLTQMYSAGITKRAERVLSER